MNIKRYISVLTWICAVAYLGISYIQSTQSNYITLAGLAIHYQYTVSAPVAGIVHSVEVDLLEPVVETDVVVEIIDPNYFQIKHQLSIDSSPQTDEVQSVQQSNFITPVTPSGAGSLTELFVKRGDSLLLGQPLLTLTSLTTDYVIVFLSEQDLKSITNGARVEILTDTDTFEGEVSQIGPSWIEIPKELSTYTQVSGIPVKIQLTKSTQLRHHQQVEVRIYKASLNHDGN